MPLDLILGAGLGAVVTLCGFLLFLWKTGLLAGDLLRTIRDLSVFAKDNNTGRWRVVTFDDLELRLRTMASLNDVDEAAGNRTGGYSPIIAGLNTQLANGLSDVHSRLNHLASENLQKHGDLEHAVGALQSGIKILHTDIHEVEETVANLALATNKGDIHVEELRAFRRDTERRLSELENRCTRLEARHG